MDWEGPILYHINFRRRQSELKGEDTLEEHGYEYSRNKEDISLPLKEA